MYIFFRKNELLRALATLRMKRGPRIRTVLRQDEISGLGGGGGSHAEHNQATFNHFFYDYKYLHSLN